MEVIEKNEQPNNAERPIIESKQSFYFGLAIGIATMSLIGLLVIGSSYVKTTFSGFNDDGAVSNIKTDQTDKKVTGDTKDKVEVKINKKDHIRGNKNAKITIVEFTDIQCPYCTRFHDSMKQVMQAYPDQVRWVLKHFPLESMHPFATKAAEATECAGEQNKFWEYTDTLYANQGSINNGYFATAAKEVGLNVDKFTKCLDSGKFKEKVAADLKYGQSLNVRGTPGSFINGIAIPGAVPFSTLDEMIKSQL